MNTIQLKGLWTISKIALATGICADELRRRLVKWGAPESVSVHSVLDQDLAKQLVIQDGIYLEREERDP